MRYEEYDATFLAVDQLEKFKETHPEISFQLGRLLNEVIDDPERGQMLQDLQQSSSADCLRIAEVFSSNPGTKSTDRFHYDILMLKDKPSPWLVLINYRLKARRRPLILMPALVIRYPNRIY